MPLTQTLMTLRQLSERTVRRSTARVEIEWNNDIYKVDHTAQQFFYSDDILFLAVLQEADGGLGTLPMGNISCNELSLTLQNIDDRFRFRNTTSPLHNAAQIGARIKAYVGFIDEHGNTFERHLGTFWSKEWTVPDQATGASTTALDRMGILQNTIYDPIYHVNIAGDPVEEPLAYGYEDYEEQGRVVELYRSWNGIENVVIDTVNKTETMDLKDEKKYDKEYLYDDAGDPILDDNGDHAFDWIEKPVTGNGHVYTLYEAVFELFNILDNSDKAKQGLLLDIDEALREFEIPLLFFNRCTYFEAIKAIAQAAGALAYIDTPTDAETAQWEADGHTDDDELLDVLRIKPVAFFADVERVIFDTVFVRDALPLSTDDYITRTPTVSRDNICNDVIIPWSQYVLKFKDGCIGACGHCTFPKYNNAVIANNHNCEHEGRPEKHAAYNKKWINNPAYKKKRKFKWWRFAAAVLTLGVSEYIYAATGNGFYKWMPLASNGEPKYILVNDTESPIWDTAKRVKDKESIDLFGTFAKEFDENHLVQKEDHAYFLGLLVLEAYRNSHRTVEIESFGDVTRRIGDVLRVPEYQRDGINKFGYYAITKIDTNYDGGLRQRITAIYVGQEDLDVDVIEEVGYATTVLNEHPQAGTFNDIENVPANVINSNETGNN